MPVWGQGPGRTGRKIQAAVDGVVIEAREVEHRVDQHGVQPPGGPARVGDLPGRLEARPAARSDSPSWESRPRIPSSMARARVQCRACPVSRPSWIRNRTIQSVARLETSC